MEAILESPIAKSTSVSPEVDALITMRLIEFHNALVERGQISAAPPSGDTSEI